MRLRVVYYTLPCFLAHVPPQARVLSRCVELHVVFEVSPWAWRYNLLDLPYPPCEPGLREGHDFLCRHLPASVWKNFEGAAGIYFAVYPPDRFLGALAAAAKVAVGIRRLEPHILHLDGESVRSALTAVLVRRPTVVSVHEPRVPMGSKLPALALVKKLLIPQADHIIVHSDACREGVEETWGLPKTRITKATLGPMELTRAWLLEGERIDENPRSVLFWGNLSPRKGIDVLLAAAPEVAKHTPGVKFVIAGKRVADYQLPALPDLANGGTIEVIPEHLASHRLARMIAEAAVVVVPYRDAMQSEVVLTAYAFGKPVVASNAGGLGEQVWQGDTGLLFRNEDPLDLAQALSGLLADDGLRERMEHRIQAMKQRELSWDRFADSVCGVWKRLAPDAEA